MNTFRLPRRGGIIVGTIVVLSGFAYLYYGLGNSLIFYATPAELLAQGEAAYDKPFRLAGIVVAGTLDWDQRASDLNFMVTDTVPKGNPATVRVHSTTIPPMMFREGIPVLVEGRYMPEGVFRATNVMVMHGNEYRELPEGATMPEDLYKDMFPSRAP